MPDGFISLNCANCGAKLDVYDDMERFACSFCGTEMRVDRRGGTVSLKSVAEAIQKLQHDADKTAAELAIVRLEKELEEDWKRREALMSKSDKLVGAVFGMGLFLVAYGLVCVGNATERGFLLLTSGAVCLWFGSTRKPPEELEQLSARIREIEHKLADLKLSVEA